MRKRAPAADAGALDPSSLFRRLAGRRGLILAVSGGPDSTALMLLASSWRERPPVLVVTVDHGLRPEAAEEARLVAENAERLKLPWRIMTAAEPRTGGNLQDWARRARYRCLSAAAREAGFDTIVTAHHEDDQAETFLLRLARGSGVYGLAAMREEETLDGIALARPLLVVSRERLRGIAAEGGLKTVADPSNVDTRFDRVRIRSLMPELAEHGLDAVRLAETAGRLGRAAKALDYYAGLFLEAHFAADPFGVVSGPASAFATVPEEVGLRVLARVLKAVGGADYTPRLASIEALREAILAIRASDRLKQTLSGVVVAVARERLTAHREWGRNGLADATAPAGATVLWDGRFRLEIPRLAGALAVGALGRAGRPLRSIVTGRDALQTLPGLYQDGTLVAAPRGILAADEGEPLDVLAVECVVGQWLGITSDDTPVLR
jgi:tRNA(Ile)-lysidine synthase